MVARPSNQQVQTKHPGGAPPSHDWDKFWIEVSIWTALNGTDDPKSRVDLQKHMENVTAVWSPQLMDQTTIRKKLKALFDEISARN